MWYDSGSVAVTNGSTTVTGTGTNFITGAQAGEAFYGPDDKLYEIASITSATALVLADAYLGSTQSGQGYKIVPTQSLVADLASDVTDLIADYADVKDKAGAGKFNDGSVTSPAITFEQDQNNGLYRIGSDNYGLSAGGQKIVDVSTSGIGVTGDLNASGNITSTGIDDNATSTAITIDASENVLIGKTATNFNTDGFQAFSGGFVHATATQGTANSGTVVTVNRKSTDGSIIDLLKSGGTIGEIGVYDGRPYLASTTLGIRISNALFPSDTNGVATDGQMNIGGTAGRFKDLYLSGGVYLGGTGSANKLDDYDEGTWTPSLPNGGTLVVSSAKYVKIGSMVHWACFITDVNPTNNGLDFNVSGLPYNSDTGTTNYWAGSVGYSANGVANRYGALVQAQGSYFYFHYIDGSAAGRVTNSQFISNMNTSAGLIISGSYKAS